MSNREMKREIHCRLIEHCLRRQQEYLGENAVYIDLHHCAKRIGKVIEYNAINDEGDQTRYCKVKATTSG